MELALSTNGEALSLRTLLRTIKDAEIDDQFWEARKSAAERSLQEIIRTFETEFESQLGQIKQAEAEWLAKIQTYDAEFSQHRQTLERMLSRLDEERRLVANRVKVAARAAKSAFDVLNETYHRKLELDAPATFWSRRARTNLWITLGAAIFFLLVAICMTWAAVKYAHSLRSFVTDPGGRIEFGAILLASPLLILPIWIFRMIGRVYATAFAESVDASQRRVMVATFLALTKDPNSKLSDAERIVILTALFRPSSGAAEDEAVPAGILEAVARLAQGTKAHQ